MSTWRMTNPSRSARRSVSVRTLCKIPPSVMKILVTAPTFGPFSQGLKGPRSRYETYNHRSASSQHRTALSSRQRAVAVLCVHRPAAHRGAACRRKLLIRMSVAAATGSGKRRTVLSLVALRDRRAGRQSPACLVSKARTERSRPLPVTTARAAMRGSSCVHTRPSVRRSRLGARQSKHRFPRGHGGQSTAPSRRRA
jgi:hypothetical protein